MTLPQEEIGASTLLTTQSPEPQGLLPGPAGTSHSNLFSRHFLQRGGAATDSCSHPLRLSVCFEPSVHIARRRVQCWVRVREQGSGKVHG